MNYLLKRFIIAVLLFIIVIFSTIQVFNISSNISYLFNNDGTFLVETIDGFKSLDEGVPLTKELYSSRRIIISNIKFTRENKSTFNQFKDLILPNKILVFEFSVNNNFSLYSDIGNGFKSVNSSTARFISNSDFAINTNFYSEKGSLIGELIIDGVRYGKRSKNVSGFFKVIDNKPVVGAKSLFTKIKGKVKYSCQAFPSVMKNGRIWSYIVSENGAYKQSWKRKTYRNLIGTLPNGNLVIVVSNRGGLLSVKEITQIAKLLGVTNASLFDAGQALQYQFNNSDLDLSFSAFNNRFSLGEYLNHKFKEITGVKFKQKSPVFLTIKLKDK